MEDLEAYRPGFFEVYAAHHLSSALRPALRFVLEVLSVRHPFLVRIAAWSDEIFTGLLLVMETSQLRKESALLAESFYSLRRSAARSFNVSTLSEEPLQRRQIVLSVLFSVLIPHAKTKLDSWYSSATGGAAAELFENGVEEFAQGNTEQENQSLHFNFSHVLREPVPTSRGPFQVLLARLRKYHRIINAIRRGVKSPAFRRLILKWYSRICTVCESINLLLNILYLYGHTRYFSLSLAVQGLILRRTNALEALQGATHANKSAGGGVDENSASNLLSAAAEKLIMVFKAAFFAGIFVFRFLQYYYAAEASAPRNVGPVLPAPVPLQPAEGIDRESAQASGSCPLCSKSRISPTACELVDVCDGFHKRWIDFRVSVLSSSNHLPLNGVISYEEVPQETGLKFVIIAQHPTAQ